ncbi:MAG: XRE family transcriptional regulator [Paludibacter sp.]|nr:XRE family transcriptional regulator [Paludibacter sp.]
MKDIIAKRIKSARNLAGFSLRELSDKMDGIVSHNAIKKYEMGVMMPDSKVLLALATALKVKTDYFFRPYEVSIENIEFRKKSKLLVKEANSIKEKVTDSISNYIELEQFLNLTTVFINPLQEILISNGEDVENAVNQLLNYWKLGFNALPNVVELLEDKEIKVIEIDDNESFDGLSGWANNNIPVIVINKNSPVDRKRLTALHELAHLLLIFDESIDQKEKERLCHRFAGAMLMPKETFIQEIGLSRKDISIPELIVIKETYGISMQAVMARAKSLGIITEERFLRFRFWLNKDSNRRKEIGFGEYVGREQSTRFKQLLYRATSEELISMSKAANLANQKLATFRDEFVQV